MNSDASVGDVANLQSIVKRAICFFMKVFVMIFIDGVEEERFAHMDYAEIFFDLAKCYCYFEQLMIVQDLGVVRFVQKQDLLHGIAYRVVKLVLISISQTFFV